MPDQTSGWDDDDRLLADLGSAMADADGVPDNVTRLGHGAFAWRTIDADLAELTFDSATALEPSGMRAGDSGPRSLTFTLGDTSIDLEFHPDAVRGQIVPGGVGTLLVRTEDEAVRTVEIDHLGWFVVTPVPVGRFRLQIHADGTNLITDWVRAD